MSDPATGRRTHCRGGAVDVTLADATGALLEMPSGFDDFSERADRDYSDCSAEAAEQARLLQEVMEGCGLVGYSGEWWHFSDGVDYPVEETVRAAGGGAATGSGRARRRRSPPAPRRTPPLPPLRRERKCSSWRAAARTPSCAIRAPQVSAGRPSGAGGGGRRRRAAILARQLRGIPQPAETPGGEALLGTVRAGEVVELLAWAGR